MPISEIKFQDIVKALKDKKVTLVAVSKTKPVEDIEMLMQMGQLDFGENYVQELLEKQNKIQGNVRWHFIGHLQSNKVKQVIPFVHLVHGVDSLKLLTEIDRQAQKLNRVVDCLMQIHIAKEETKFGMTEAELYEVLDALPSLRFVNVKGLMGMATLTDDAGQVRSEYRWLSQLYNKLIAERPECASFDTLSMGMSSDYMIAVEEGSTMVRIGSLIFGDRNYNGSK